jgi:hypothetical protein
MTVGWAPKDRDGNLVNSNDEMAGILNGFIARVFYREGIHLVQEVDPMEC